MEPAGEGLTRVRLIHADLAQSPKTWANVEHGWVWILDSMKSLLETGSPLPPTELDAGLDSGRDREPAAEWHRMQAVEANNSAWNLIGLPDRDAEGDEDMLRRAYTAAYHWDRAAGRTPGNSARADWLLSKVHLLAGHPDTALLHAARCLSTCETHGLKDFDLAYAHEATARALKALGRDDEATRSWEAAKAVPIADEEDREHVEEDLAVGP